MLFSARRLSVHSRRQKEQVCSATRHLEQTAHWTLTSGGTARRGLLSAGQHRSCCHRHCFNTKVAALPYYWASQRETSYTSECENTLHPYEAGWYRCEKCCVSVAISVLPKSAFQIKIAIALQKQHPEHTSVYRGQELNQCADFTLQKAVELLELNSIFQTVKQ